MSPPKLSKMYLLSPETFQKYKNNILNESALSDLDKRMLKILYNKKMNNIQKWYNYRQQLIRYTNLERNNVSHMNSANNVDKSVQPTLVDKSVQPTLIDDDDISDIDQSIEPPKKHLFDYDDTQGYIYDNETPRMNKEEFESSLPPLDMVKFNQIVNRKLDSNDLLDESLNENDQPKTTSTPTCINRQIVDLHTPTTTKNVPKPKLKPPQIAIRKHMTRLAKRTMSEPGHQIGKGRKIQRWTKLK